MDIDSFLNAFLGPIFASWNGTSSILDHQPGVHVPRTTHDVAVKRFKIHSDGFPHVVNLWYAPARLSASAV